MYIAAGRNRLYAKQGRTSANQYADETRDLFARDAILSSEYNKLLNGKWNHMMDQTHIGYTFWNEPPVNAMPAVEQVQPLRGARMSVFVEGPEPSQPTLPDFDAANQQVRSIDIANRGIEPFRYTASASAPWIHINEPAGTVTTDHRIKISIDWNALPPGISSGLVTITHDGAASSDTPTKIAIRARKAEGISGFAENNGMVTIDAAHATSNRSADGAAWQQIPGFCETLSAMEVFPVHAPSAPPSSVQACMDYAFYIYDAGARTLQSILAPTLSFTPTHGLRYSIAIDTQPATIVNAWASNTDADWARSVSDGVHKVSAPLGELSAGRHTLHFCSVDPGVVLERLLISSGKASQTYLGPPESAFIAPKQ